MTLNLQMTKIDSNSVFEIGIKRLLQEDIASGQCTFWDVQCTCPPPGYREEEKNIYLDIYIYFLLLCIVVILAILRNIYHHLLFGFFQPPTKLEQ